MEEKKQMKIKPEKKKIKQIKTKPNEKLKKIKIKSYTTKKKIKKWKERL